MPRKIRLLQIIDQLGDAGAENLIYTFAAGVDRTRFDLHICALRPWPYPKNGPALRALGLPVVELNQHNSYDLPTLLALVRYIRRHRIDIIHTHLLASDIMGRVAGFLTRCPVVSTIHNSRVDLEQEPRHRQLMERWSAHLWCRRLIAVSALLQPEIAAWFRVPPGRVVAISNGIDTDRFHPGAAPDRGAMQRALFGGEYPIVANVARLMPQKAQHFLIEAAAIVTAARPDARFALVGDGPRRAELLALAAARGLGDKLVITGQRTDVPAILAASDVFVLSSLWEGMPLSLLEAMAAGRPAVATDVGGVRQVLTDGQTGLLVPPGDPAALAAAILAILGDPARAQRMGQAARARVLRDYGMGTMVRKWEAVYLHELRGSRRRPAGALPRGRED